MSPVSIQQSDPPRPAALHLVQQLDTYLNRIYPPESNHLISAEALRQPHVQFLTVQKGETVAGCVALVNHGDYEEIKRFLSKPNFGGGHQLLQALEAQANTLHPP